MVFSYNSKTIIILGPARAGTFLVAGALHILGVDMGRLSDSRKSNPFGDFEDIDIVALNRKIFSTAKPEGSYKNPPSAKEIAQVEHIFVDEIKHVITQRSKKYLWGWKAPWSLLTIELFLPYITSPYFITVTRNKEAISSSFVHLMKGSVSLAQARELTNFYTHAVADILKRHPQIPSLHINTDDYLNDSDALYSLLVDFLQLQPLEEQREKLRTFIITPEKRKIKWQQVQRAIFFKKRLPWLITYILPRFIYKCIRHPLSMPAYIHHGISTLSLHLHHPQLRNRKSPYDSK